MILAGDVGGTKTNLGFFDASNGRLVCVATETYANKQFRGLEEIVRRFLAGEHPVTTSACFGVAGPVRDGRCDIVNLPWTVSAEGLRGQLGTDEVYLLNDLQATAHSVSVLSSTDIVELNPGAPIAEGNRAVIAAGTGLGEAGMYWDGCSHEPFASEGGHASFSPRNSLEMALASFLIEKYGHASWERVLSGPGLVSIYDFFTQVHTTPTNSTIQHRIVREGAAAITDAALKQQCPACERSLELFVSLYGAEAGNLALKMLARGGVYIGGGIAAKIIPKLNSQTFLEAFVSKGRMRALLESIPIRVIKTNRAALLGAAQFATTRSAGNSNGASLDFVSSSPIPRRRD